MSTDKHTNGKNWMLESVILALAFASIFTAAYLAKDGNSWYVAGPFVILGIVLAISAEPIGIMANKQ